jgi:hypothetical protein
MHHGVNCLASEIGIKNQYIIEKEFDRSLGPGAPRAAVPSRSSGPHIFHGMTDQVFQLVSLLLVWTKCSLGSQYHIAVARFESNVRFGQHGIPCSLITQGGMQCVVTSHKLLNKNQWVKVQLHEEVRRSPLATPVSSLLKTAILIEILGQVFPIYSALLATVLTRRAGRSAISRSNFTLTSSISRSSRADILSPKLGAYSHRPIMMAQIPQTHGPHRQPRERARSEPTAPAYTFSLSIAQGRATLTTPSPSSSIPNRYSRPSPAPP